ncbi:MAG: hypothetical protein NC093_09600 [Alistipes sp.]|nr:hypothetical protein [Alistipes sp.]
MKKLSVKRIFAGAALCLSVGLSAAPVTSNAASAADAAAVARSLGIPEEFIQQGWNAYYANPEKYPPEVIDSYIEVLYGMGQEAIDQLIRDNGGTVTPSQPVVTTAPPVTAAVVTTKTTAVSQGSPTTPAQPSTPEKTDDGSITLIMPDGSTFTRVSAAKFAAMTLEEKRAYIAGFTPEQQSVFLANLSPDDYKSLLKQMDIDSKVQVLDSVTGITDDMGLNITVDELTEDNLLLSMRDENGQLVAIGSAGDTVADTGYDRRMLFAVAAGLIAAGGAGAVVLAKKCFRKNENEG